MDDVDNSLKSLSSSIPTSVHTLAKYFDGSDPLGHRPREPVFEFIVLSMKCRLGHHFHHLPTLPVAVIPMLQLAVTILSIGRRFMANPSRHEVILPTHRIRQPKTLIAGPGDITRLARS